MGLFRRWANEIGWFRSYFRLPVDPQIEDVASLLKPVGHLPPVPDYTREDQET